MPYKTGQQHLLSLGQQRTQIRRLNIQHLSVPTVDMSVFFFVISLPFAFSAAASRFIWIFMLKRFCFLWLSFVRLICAYEWLKPTKEQVLNRKRTSERKSERESACFLSHFDLGACAKKGVNLILTMWAMPLKLKQKKYGQKYLL